MDVYRMSSRLGLAVVWEGKGSRARDVVGVRWGVVGGLGWVGYCTGSIL